MSQLGEGCLWRPVGRDQGCCWTSYNVQDGPHPTKNPLAPNFSGVKVEKSKPNGLNQILSTLQSLVHSASSRKPSLVCCLSLTLPIGL